MSDVIMALKQLSNGDDVILTVDGDKYEAQVVEHYHEPAERDKWGPVKGELTIHLDLSNGTVNRHELPTHTANIRVVEPRKDEWRDPSISIRDPVVEEGSIIKDDYRSLGDLQRIEIVGE